MSALREKRTAIIGSEPPARAYREALGDFPELLTHEAGSVQDLLKGRTMPEVALLCTPPHNRFQEIAPLVRAGVDVLVNGPLAITRGEAVRITDLSEQLDRTVMTAAPFRRSDTIARAGALIDEGRIGRLGFLQITLSRKFDPRRSWRADPRLSGGGVWMAYGPDSLDLVEALAGPVERIRMLEAKHHQGGAVEDEVLIDTQHLHGTTSRIRLSWNDESPAPIARCVGEDGEIRIGWAQSVLLTEGDETVFAAEQDQRDICRALLKEFLTERIRPEPTEDHGDQTMSWIEAAYRSLQTDLWEIA
jgi:predicted dehydrogenase